MPTSLSSLHRQIIAQSNYFDTSSVDAVIEAVTAQNAQALIVIKSTIPVGFVNEARERFANENIVFQNADHNFDLYLV